MPYYVPDPEEDPAGFYNDPDYGTNPPASIYIEPEPLDDYMPPWTPPSSPGAFPGVIIPPLPIIPSNVSSVIPEPVTGIIKNFSNGLGSLGTGIDIMGFITKYWWIIAIYLFMGRKQRIFGMNIKQILPLVALYLLFTTQTGSSIRQTNIGTPLGGINMGTLASFALLPKMGMLAATALGGLSGALGSTLGSRIGSYKRSKGGYRRRSSGYRPRRRWYNKRKRY